MTENIKLLTYNIHKGFNPSNTSLVLSGIREFVRENNPDIVFLQEIQGMHEVKSRKITQWPSESQMEYLADSVWEHFAYGKNAIYKYGHHGNAILSKFPFISWENHNVSMFKKASRSFLYGKIENPKNSSPLHLICIHLGLFSLERSWQIKQLKERVLSEIPENEPVLLAGDFNDWRGALRGRVESIGFTEVFESLSKVLPKTWPVRYPLFPVDRIYYRNLKPVSADLPRPVSFGTLSDHLPLEATFSWG